jgi:hypothetical protein
MKKTLVATAVMAAMAFASSAHAAPKTGDTVLLTCDNGLPTGHIDVPPNDALWTPGFPIANGGRFIPYENTSQAWFVPDAGGTVDLGATFDTRPAPRANLPHGTCTYAGAILVDDFHGFGSGTLMFEGSVKVFWTPA